MQPFVREGAYDSKGSYDYKGSYVSKGSYDSNKGSYDSKGSYNAKPKSSKEEGDHMGPQAESKNEREHQPENNNNNNNNNNNRNNEDESMNNNEECWGEYQPAVQEVPPPRPEHFNPITGLENLGNTCYANSVFQVLRFTPGFTSGLKHVVETMEFVEEKLQVWITI